MDREGSDVSGVYMRSLVKKMSSSMNGVCQNGKVGQCSSSQVVQPQQHKKKIRRRLHTSRPYQERLLNMAEARREIVTALKVHRASMKQKKEQEEPLKVVEQPPMSNLYPDLVSEVGMNPGKGAFMIQQPSDAGLSSLVDKSQQPWPPFTYDSSYHMFSPDAAGVPSDDNSSFSFALPNQTLGLNLNFQDLSNLSTSHFQTNPSLFTSPSSSSSSPALSSTTTDEFHSAAEDVHKRAALVVSKTDSVGGGGGAMAYPSMDSEVMKEIKSMGDCYDMVWNDTINSLTSAWWHKLSKTTELGTEDSKQQAEDEHMLPSWLNATDSSYLQSHLNIASSPDPSLPCMDIGEIEGIDGEWLA